jgi:hypothetical protein
MFRTSTNGGIKQHKSGYRNLLFANSITDVESDCCRHESQLWNLPNCGLRQACYLSELPSLTWPVLSSLEIMAIWRLYDYLKKIKI